MVTPRLLHAGASVLVMIVLGAVPATAQRGPARAPTPPAAGACRIDSTAPWFKRQREWLGDVQPAWTNDSLRKALLAAVDPAGASLSAVQLGVFVSGRGSVARGPAMDAAIAQLRSGGRGGPWPTKSAVGVAGARALTVLALSDTGFTYAAVRRMEEGGPEESFAADVALLEDRSRILHGRKQIYGTQFRVDAAGAIVLEPMEDSTHADLRREDAGLPPFALGLCLAKGGK